MLSSYWLAAPFILQMLCMAGDELWFHRKRGLPRWERIGHPLDTLTVILCLLWILWVRPSRPAVAAFAGLAIVSCLFVTKDESIHWRYCTAAEQWVHAILFILHPVVLASAAFLWPAISGGMTGPSWIVRYFGFERPFLTFTCALMLGFGLYQFVFWNLLWRPKSAVR